MKTKTKTLGTVLVIGVMVLAECVGGQRKGQIGQVCGLSGEVTPAPRLQNRA